MPSDQDIAGTMVRKEGAKGGDKRYERMRFINQNRFSDLLSEKIPLTGIIGAFTFAA
jgi:hypothetical protein